MQPRGVVVLEAPQDTADTAAALRVVGEIPERGDVPPAFPVTEDIARVVRQRGLRVSQIVGVHGRTGTWAELETSLRRRATCARLLGGGRDGSAVNRDR